MLQGRRTDVAHPTSDVSVNDVSRPSMYLAMFTTASSGPHTGRGATRTSFAVDGSPKHCSREPDRVHGWPNRNLIRERLDILPAGLVEIGPSMRYAACSDLGERTHDRWMTSSLVGDRDRLSDLVASERQQQPARQ